MNTSTQENGCYTMPEQCDQEFASSHQEGLSLLLKTCSHEGEYGIKDMSYEHIAHQDLKYLKKELMPSGEIEDVKGYYEGKHDTWDTLNIVVEYIGSVRKSLLDKYELPFPYKSARFHPHYQSEMYDRIHDFITLCISGELGKINLGYASVDSSSIGQNPLFGYFRRPHKRIKDKKGKWFDTGEILSRNIYIYNGDILKRIAMECFHAKKGEFQIVSNNRGDNFWVSINLLINKDTFLEALTAIVHLTDDTTANNIILIDKKDS